MEENLPKEKKGKSFINLERQGGYFYGGVSLGGGGGGVWGGRDGRLKEEAKIMKKKDTEVEGDWLTAKKAAKGRQIMGKSADERKVKNFQNMDIIEGSSARGGGDTSAQPQQKKGGRRVATMVGEEEVALSVR